MEEKKYKEALERARKLQENSNGMILKKWLWKVFPELAKSEDEKIKEDLIQWINEFPDTIWRGHYKKDIIAWLEKQSEQKPTDNVEQKFNEGDWVVYNCDICQIVKREEGCNKLVTKFGVEKELVNERNLSTAKLWTIQDAKPGDVLAIEPIDNYQYPFVAIYKEGCLSHFNSYCMIAFNGKFYIDETGHQTNVHPATKEQRDLLFKKMHEAGYEWDANKKELKKIVQKPTNSYCRENRKGFQETGKCFADGDCKAKIEAESIDKAELKFKPGEWVATNFNNHYSTQITSVEDTGYETNNPEGFIRFKDEKDFHIWTIQDAKDGDVVVDKSDGIIGIFQSIGHHDDGGSYNDPSYCFLHCRYDDGFFYADFELGNSLDSNDITPATKEQREFLFQKMKETGYEWDTEKKELKKIE